MQDLKGKKIIVTGGAGFIGSHTCEALLKEDCRVISIDNFNSFYDPAIKEENVQSILQSENANNFISLKEDIRNEDALMRIFEQEKPDAVIHLAAMAGVRPSIAEPLLYTDVNVKGTQNVLEACVEVGTRHFIFASSSSVYGNSPYVPFCEDDNVDFPISPYAATKKAGELFCHTYAHLYGMAIYALRFFTVYGPRQRPDLAIHKFSKLIAEEKEIPFYGDGSTERDYTYIDDILQGMLSALSLNFQERKKKFEVINLGGSETVSLKEMVEVIEDAVGKKALIRSLPKQPGDVDRTYADIRKAQKMLQFSPETSFRTGIEKFSMWLRNKTEINITV